MIYVEIKEVSYGWFCCKGIGYLWHDGTWRSTAYNGSSSIHCREARQGWFKSKEEIIDILWAGYGANFEVKNDNLNDLKLLVREAEAINGL